MKIARGLALAALLCMLGTASAQLKPSGPTTPPLPPSQTELQRAEAPLNPTLASELVNIGNSTAASTPHPPNQAPPVA